MMYSWHHEAIPQIRGHLRQGRVLEQTSYTFPAETFEEVSLTTVILSSALAALLVIMIIGCLRARKSGHIFSRRSTKGEVQKFEDQNKTPELEIFTEARLEKQETKITDKDNTNNL